MSLININHAKFKLNWAITLCKVIKFCFIVLIIYKCVCMDYKNLIFFHAKLFFHKTSYLACKMKLSFSDLSIIYQSFVASSVDFITFLARAIIW